MENSENIENIESNEQSGHRAYSRNATGTDQVVQVWL